MRLKINKEISIDISDLKNVEVIEGGVIPGYFYVQEFEEIKNTPRLSSCNSCIVGWIRENIFKEPRERKYIYNNCIIEKNLITRYTRLVDHNVFTDGRTMEELSFGGVSLKCKLGDTNADGQIPLVAIPQIKFIYSDSRYEDFVVESDKALKKIVKEFQKFMKKSEQLSINIYSYGE